MRSIYDERKYKKSIKIVLLIVVAGGVIWFGYIKFKEVQKYNNDVARRPAGSAMATKNGCEAATGHVCYMRPACGWFNAVFMKGICSNEFWVDSDISLPPKDITR